MSAPIIVGISGGVDSSVSALLLQRAGYEVQGLFMKNWEEDDQAGYCSAAEDLHDAQAVCDKLAIPLHRVNFAAEYWDTVFQHCLDEYRAGRTPNPDVLCNREIKFKVFLEHALRLGGTAIATGHYARISQENGLWQLRKGLDPHKDQSYFLHLLNQHALRHSYFPIGELDKNAVRALAQEAGLSTHAKKDSTGICFIGERQFKQFLQRFLPAQPGLMVDVEGTVIGAHDGLMFYTLGQRQGLGIGGRAGSSGAPWFVVDKDLAQNRLIVAQGEHSLLYSSGLIAEDLHWIAGEAPPLPLMCAAKTRYRQPDQACQVLALDNNRCEVIFAAPQRAVTPGQSVVFYAEEICLGGGIISEVVRAKLLKNVLTQA
jgi:tRNA-uridine 2-sulfurtransferase